MFNRSVPPSGRSSNTAMRMIHGHIESIINRPAIPPEDTQQLANDMLNDSFDRLLQSSRIEGKELRLRDHTE